MYVRTLLLTLGLAIALAGSAAAVGAAPLAAKDRFFVNAQIDARPPLLPVAIPAVCAVTVAKSGTSTAICRNTAPNPFPPAKTTTVTQVPCGPTVPYTGRGTLVVQKNGSVQLECHVPK